MKKLTWLMFAIMALGCALYVVNSRYIGNFLGTYIPVGMASACLMVAVPLLWVLIARKPIAIFLVPVATCMIAAMLTEAAIFYDSPVVRLEVVTVIGIVAGLAIGIVSWFRNKEKLHNPSLGWSCALMVLVGTSWYLLPRM